MLEKNVAIEDEATPASTPEVVSKLEQEDRKQAVVQRFKGSADPATATRSKKRSPYWQPADDQC